MKPEKAKHLLKNTGILAMGEFSSKILVFLLIPLYTAVLTTEEYGSYDIIYSTVALLIPVLTFNIAGALLRFPLEQNADLPGIAHIGLLLVFGSSLIVFVLQLVPDLPWSTLEGFSWFAPLYASTALYQSLTLLARGLDRMRDIAVAGVLSALLLAALNIWLLVFVRWGLNGYFAANVVAMLLPALWLLWRMRSVIFASGAKRGSSGLFLRMVRYSLPLAGAVIGWWLIGMSDRYIVMVLCGMDANGLYSVAYRIPSILSAVCNIFLQAWQISAVKEFDSRDEDGFLRGTFALTETVVVVLCSVMIPLSPIIGAVMFSGEFYVAWKYVPLLLVYAALNAMSGMWGPFFSAVFDSKVMAASTFLAGILNVATGIPLVMLLGVQGACISSVLAGFASWGFRAYKVRDYIKVGFGVRRSAVLYILLTVQAIAMCFDLSEMIQVLVQFFFVSCFLIVRRKDVVPALQMIGRAVKSKCPH